MSSFSVRLRAVVIVSIVSAGLSVGSTIWTMHSVSQIESMGSVRHPAILPVAETDPCLQSGSITLSAPAEGSQQHLSPRELADIVATSVNVSQITCADITLAK